MANQTEITIDLSSSTVTNITVSDLYAPKANPVLTGYVNATSASAVALPSNTTIGNITSTELSYLDGVTGNIQSQLSTISLSGSVTGNIYLSQSSNSFPPTSGAIVFEGSTLDNNQLFLIPQNPINDDTYLYLPATGTTDYLITSNSTATFINKTFDTANNVFKLNGQSITSITGSGSVVFSNNPTITNPTINSVYLTGYTGSGNNVVLSSSPSIYQPTFSGNVIAYADLYVGGNLQVQGTTTTLNTNNLTVNDKNIELASVSSVTVASSATIGTVSGSGPYTATITLATGGSPNVIPGETLTATTGTGSLGTGTVTVTGTPSTSTITVSSTASMTAGTITNLVSGGATDLTANGGGITLKGTSNKTITYDSANFNWTSSEHWNIDTGKVFKINNNEVLSANKVLGRTPGGTASGDIVTIDAQQTLTKKALTSPLIVRSVRAKSVNGSTSLTFDDIFWSELSLTHANTGITTSLPTGATIEAGLTAYYGSTVPVGTSFDFIAFNPSTGSNGGSLSATSIAGITFRGTTGFAVGSSYITTFVKTADNTYTAYKRQVA